MSSPTLPTTAAPALNPPKIEVTQSWPYAVLAIALFALVYMVGAEEGATSIFAGSAIHEFVHDGRHLLGFPCH